MPPLPSSVVRLALLLPVVVSASLALALAAEEAVVAWVPALCGLRAWWRVRGVRIVPLHAGRRARLCVLRRGAVASGVRHAKSLRRNTVLFAQRGGVRGQEFGLGLWIDDCLRRPVQAWRFGPS